MKKLFFFTLLLSLATTSNAFVGWFSRDNQTVCYDANRALIKLTKGVSGLMLAEGAARTIYRQNPLPPLAELRNQTKKVDSYIYRTRMTLHNVEELNHQVQDQFRKFFIVSRLRCLRQSASGLQEFVSSAPLNDTLAITNFLQRSEKVTTNLKRWEERINEKRKEYLKRYCPSITWEDYKPMSS